jgi:hypothetical protein
MSFTVGRDWPKRQGIAFDGARFVRRTLRDEVSGAVRPAALASNVVELLT